MEYHPTEAAREGRKLVGRSIILRADRYKWDQGWKILEYDDEKDRYLIVPQNSKHPHPTEENQWVKRENFDPV